MAVRNFKASLLPPPAPTGGCCSPLCIIVSYCQMMAMGLTTFQPGDEGGKVLDVGDVDACMDGGKEEEDGVLVKDAGGAVVDSESMDEGGEW